MATTSHDLEALIAAVIEELRVEAAGTAAPGTPPAPALRTAVPGTTPAPAPGTAATPPRTVAEAAGRSNPAATTTARPGVAPGPPDPAVVARISQRVTDHLEGRRRG